jgi:hypothetical protein
MSDPIDINDPSVQFPFEGDIPVSERKVHINAYRGTIQALDIYADNSLTCDGTLYVNKIVDNVVNPVIVPSTDFPTIQSAIDYFNGKVAQSATIQILPGVYNESIIVDAPLSLNLGDNSIPNGFNIIGDSRDFVGTTYLQNGFNANGYTINGLPTPSPGMGDDLALVTLATIGSSIVVTVANLDFDVMGVVVGDTIKIRDDNASWTETTVTGITTTNTPNDTLQYAGPSITVGGSGSALVMCPNVQLRSSNVTSYIVATMVNCNFQGLWINTTTTDIPSQLYGTLSANGANVALINCLFDDIEQNTLINVFCSLGTFRFIKYGNALTKFICKSNTVIGGQLAINFSSSSAFGGYINVFDSLGYNLSLQDNNHIGQQTRVWQLVGGFIGVLAVGDSFFESDYAIILQCQLAIAMFNNSSALIGTNVTGTSNMLIDCSYPGFPAGMPNSTGIGLIAESVMSISGNVQFTNMQVGMDIMSGSSISIVTPPNGIAPIITFSNISQIAPGPLSGNVITEIGSTFCTSNSILGFGNIYTYTSVGSFTMQNAWENQVINAAGIVNLSYDPSSFELYTNAMIFRGKTFTIRSSTAFPHTLSIVGCFNAVFGGIDSYITFSNTNTQTITLISSNNVVFNLNVPNPQFTTIQSAIDFLKGGNTGNITIASDRYIETLNLENINSNPQNIALNIQGSAGINILGDIRPFVGLSYSTGCRNANWNNFYPGMGNNGDIFTLAAPNPNELQIVNPVVDFVVMGVVTGDVIKLRDDTGTWFEANVTGFVTTVNPNDTITYDGPSASTFALNGSTMIICPNVELLGSLSDVAIIRASTNATLTGIWINTDPSHGGPAVPSGYYGLLYTDCANLNIANCLFDDVQNQAFNNINMANSVVNWQLNPDNFRPSSILGSTFGFVLSNTMSNNGYTTFFDNYISSFVQNMSRVSSYCWQTVGSLAGTALIIGSNMQEYYFNCYQCFIGLAIETNSTVSFVASVNFDGAVPGSPGGVADGTAIAISGGKLINSSVMNISNMQTGINLQASTFINEYYQGIVTTPLITFTNITQLGPNFSADIATDATSEVSAVNGSYTGAVDGNIYTYDVGTYQLVNQTFNQVLAPTAPGTVDLTLDPTATTANFGHTAFSPYIGKTYTITSNSTDLHTITLLNGSFIQYNLANTTVATFQNLSAGAFIVFTVQSPSQVIVKASNGVLFT